MLQGREPECAAIDELLSGVRAGRSGALVVRGEPGVGKTTLLEHAARVADGLQVAHAVGVESEMELPFAGLHQLCAPLLGKLERLPAPQRSALATAFGVGSGGVPDRFLVGLATLSLLSEAAEEQPLVCLVDDAHWLDRASAQALAFVARRIAAESVALLFAVREPGEAPALEGLPELRIDGLPAGEAAALLTAVLAGPLDERVRDRIVAETRGNPLALLELPRAFTPGELGGGFGMPKARALSGRIEEGFRRRVEPLEADSRMLLVVAAAEPLGDPALLWRAASALGIGPDAARPVEADGLLELGARVRFRHPLVRSAVYEAATPEVRRRAHRALAEATDPAVDPDRRVWHRAHAAAGPDEGVAAELERSAARAQARGGFAAAAAFLERAAALTPDPCRTAGRAFAAAEAKHRAGAPRAALRWLALADTGGHGAPHPGHVQLLRAQIAFALRRDAEAPPLFLDAARKLEPLDASSARETYLEAIWAATFAGRSGSRCGLEQVARAARAAPPAAQPPRPVDLLLDGLAVRFTDGYAAAAPMLKRALRAFRTAAAPDDLDIRWLWLAMDLWDNDAWSALAERQVRRARETGALTVLPLALNALAGVRLHRGRFADAGALVDEAETITAATGSARMHYVAPVLAAWRGREPDASSRIHASAREAAARGDGAAITLCEYATAVLCNGCGRYRSASAAARRASEVEELAMGMWGPPELIEAAARCGMLELAGEALERLSRQTRAVGSDWALGIEARSRALLSDARDAEGSYREAIDRLSRTWLAADLARAHLVYGEWLRRRHRRRDAREQLRRAHERFSAMGAEAFAERAARELSATGEHARRRLAEAGDELTPQERQIAWLARDGATNPEIAAQLFISPRTVEYHLHKVFAKLAIGSRHELASALPRDAHAAPALLSARGPTGVPD